MVLFVVVPTTFSCGGSKTYCYFNFYGDKCTIDNQSEAHIQINLGEEDLMFQIVPEEKYILPKEIKTESPNITYDSDQGIIKISKVLGDITISATAEYGYSHFSFAGVNCAINDQKIYNEDILTGTKDIVYYVKPLDGYVLPTEIDGVDGTNITYNKEDGSIHISEMTSDINIAAVSKYKYSFTFTGTNCMINGSDTYSTDLIEGDQTIVFTINPTDKYIYPLKKDVVITGKGAKNAIYNETDGTITITEVTGNINVKAETTQEENIILRFDPDNGNDPFKMWTKNNTPIDPPENPTKKDKIRKYIFNGWHRVLLDGIESEPFDFKKPENYYGSIINLKALWEDGDLNNYVINAENTNHIAFETTDGDDLTNIEITANKDFIFVMKIVDQSNDSEYILPDVLDIFVGDSKIPLAREKYGVQWSETTAYVLIYGENITGDIVVSSEGAVLIEHYNYKIEASYGVEKIENGEHRINEPLQITFIPTENYTLPKAENIYVYFDGIEEYVSPAEQLASPNCVYNDKTGVLTISSTENQPWIKTNISIYVRANNYQLLNDLKWEEISSLGNCGYAKYLFYIGEKKTISVYNHAHIIMIIDFDFDRKSSTIVRAPYTFQFYNIVTKDYGQSYNTPWNKTGFEKGDNCDYRKSNLNDFVNNTVFKALPPELQSRIISVSKKAELANKDGEVYTTVDFDTRLFPLSASEMTRKNKEAYSLYKNAKKNDYARPRVGAGNEDYWARTPYGGDGYKQFYGAKVQSAYNSICGELVWMGYGVTPAFCI